MTRKLLLLLPVLSCLLAVSATADDGTQKPGAAKPPAKPASTASQPRRRRRRKGTGRPGGSRPTGSSRSRHRRLRRRRPGHLLPKPPRPRLSTLARTRQASTCRAATACGGTSRSGPAWRSRAGPPRRPSAVRCRIPSPESAIVAFGRLQRESQRDGHQRAGDLGRSDAAEDAADGVRRAVVRERHADTRRAGRDRRVDRVSLRAPGPSRPRRLPSRRRWPWVSRAGADFSVFFSKTVGVGGMVPVLAGPRPTSR